MHSGTYVMAWTVADKADNQERRPRDGEDETCAQELNSIWSDGQTDRCSVALS